MLTRQALVESIYRIPEHCRCQTAILKAKRSLDNPPASSEILTSTAGVKCNLRATRRDRTFGDVDIKLVCWIRICGRALSCIYGKVLRGVKGRV